MAAHGGRVRGRWSGGGDGPPLQAGLHGGSQEGRKDHWVRSSRAFPEGEVTDSSGNSWGQGS